MFYYQFKGISLSEILLIILPIWLTVAILVCHGASLWIVNLSSSTLLLLYTFLAYVWNQRIFARILLVFNCDCLVRHIIIMGMYFKFAIFTICFWIVFRYSLKSFFQKYDFFSFVWTSFFIFSSFTHLVWF